MKNIWPYLRLVAALLAVMFVSTESEFIFSFFEHAADAEILITFFVVALIFVLSFSIFYLAEGTVLPSFVVAIFFGMAAKPLFAPVIHNETALAALVGFGATLILFGGGLETPFTNFKKLFWKILSLAFVALFVTAVLFSLGLEYVGAAFDMAIPIAVAVLLGAVLASTDPAAIIPILKRLRFEKQATKDIIVSESAMTDVTGTLLTVAVLTALAAAGSFSSVFHGYGGVFSPEAGIVLAKQVGFGILFGVAGWGLLEVMTRFKARHEREFEVDSAFFLFIPVIIFTVALALGGSGYLAAFIAGLLFSMSEPLHETERFFNHIIDGFFKPVIFLLLGALVNVGEMIDYAAIGIASAILFMFVIRPIAVFIAIGPFVWIGKQKLTWRELLFISFVRETGAIPAVLLVTIVSLGIPGMTGLVPIGMWVILLTLIIEPPLTPAVAKWLKVATIIGDENSIEIGNESSVVLSTRSMTWKHRISEVVDWAKRHNIRSVVVLLCLEYHYNKEREEEIKQAADKKFAQINERLRKRNETQIKFTFISRKGFLQKNIDALAQSHPNVAAVFVGRKMLDYRLSDVKNLHVPVYFME